MLFAIGVHAQKVGVVLSGGGADGISHIGFLKALEENNIPIDYIAGTSMGALIAGMYASGYSPAQMEQFVKKEKFKNWAEGEIEEKYVYYFKKKENDASWISFRFSVDTLLKASLPTNLISPIPIDFGLVEMFARATASSSNNFDSLFVPYRCVASNISEKRQQIFADGDLGQCIRASMSYPFYIKALKKDNQLYFDGGLYNNFPVDVMYDNFKPDIIIGSNVSESVEPPDEDDLISQIKNIFITRGAVIDLPVKTIVVEPKVGYVGLFEFGQSERLIASGYEAANIKIEEISQSVLRRSDSTVLATKRKRFMEDPPQLVFDKVNITGLNKSQSNYVKKLLGLKKNKIITLEELKPQYFRLAADQKIKQIYPLAVRDTTTNYYALNLKVKKEKDLLVSFGGNFSSRPINAAYIGAQYNYLGKVAVSVFANSYFGKFYGSYQVKLHVDFPLKNPLYLELAFTRNRWDYFKSSTAFFEDSKPSFLLQNENYLNIDFGLPAKNKGKFLIGGNATNLYDSYYQTKSFTQADTTDRTEFFLLSPYVQYERSNLNRKQFANAGSYLALRYRYVFGNEITDPGTTSANQQFETSYHEWYQIKFIFENYYKRRGRIRLGFYTENVMSNQAFFANYTASILAAPQFAPIPEAKTFFIENYRAHNYFSFGLKNIINIYNNFDLRLEGYVFQPYQSILSNENFRPYHSANFSKRYFIASGILVYQTPIGPVSLSANYYSQTEKKLSILFSFGYLLFNKRALD